MILIVPLREVEIDRLTGNVFRSKACRRVTIELSKTEYSFFLSRISIEAALKSPRSTIPAFVIRDLDYRISTSRLSANPFPQAGSTVVPSLI